MQKFWGGLLVVGLALMGCARTKLQNIDVFFIADVQGFYFSRPEPRLDNQKAGGYGILKNFLQNRSQNFLLFDGGNWFGSGAEGMLSKAAYVPVLSKSIPFTAGTVTDKDLAYGWPVARNLIKELNYPFVVANLKLDRQIPWPLHDYQIHNVSDIKIGIFGPGALARTECIGSDRNGLTNDRSVKRKRGGRCNRTELARGYRLRRR